jgi:acetyltransferase-like isoleucine patch superfamily enzyme
MSKPELIEIAIKNVLFGKNVKIVQPVNIYGCEIGSNCFIGPFTEIQKNVKIGENTKVQSHAFICELVEIGANCFISHGVKFVNDLFATGGPARGDKSLWKPTRIGDNVSVGTNATILPVNICKNVVIGAGAVVTQNINTPGIYAGNPARKIRGL